MLLIEDKRFYTYLYLDSRKPGKYIYNDGQLVLDYEPFYVGKGQGNRYNYHLDAAVKINKNSHKLNKIRKILKENQEPIIIKFLDNVSEQEAFDKEIELIWIIGRYDLGLGPLTNLTNGGEGGSGMIHNNDTIKKISDASKIMWSQRTSKEIQEISEKISKAVSESRDRIYTDMERENRRISGLKSWENDERKRAQSERQLGKKKKPYNKRDRNTKEGMRIVKNWKNGSIKTWEKRNIERDLLNPIIIFACDDCNKIINNMRSIEIAERLNKFNGFICKTRNGCAQNRIINKKKLKINSINN